MNANGLNHFYRIVWNAAKGVWMAGVRYLQGPWSLDGTLAWRTDGGKPQSDTQAKEPRVWIGLVYKL
jgi:hypothetical protein